MNHIDVDPKKLGLPSRPELALKLLDMGFQIDPLGNLFAPASVSFFDCGDSVTVTIDVGPWSGTFIAFTLPSTAAVDAYTSLRPDPVGGERAVTLRAKRE